MQNLLIIERIRYLDIHYATVSKMVKRAQQVNYYRLKPVALIAV
jgi:hypothetical protein